MSKHIDERVGFGRFGSRVIEAAFDGGDIVSDGGVMLLRQVDLRLGLTQSAAAVFDDSRRATSVTHGVREMLTQRIYALCCGWQDVTDHNILRRDAVLQTAVGQVEELELASGPTLSRLVSAVLQTGLSVAQTPADKTVMPEPTGVPVQAVPDHEAWELAKRRDTAPAYQGYLGAFPSGRFAGSARSALAGMQPSQPSALQPQAPQQPSSQPPAQATLQSGQC